MLTTHIQKIKESIGIDITLLSCDGVIAATTLEVDDLLPDYTPPPIFAGEILQCSDKEITYFGVFNTGLMYIGYIDGCDKVAYNYATLISSLLSCTVHELEQVTTKEQEMKFFLEGRLTKAQAEDLKKRNSSHKDSYILLFLTQKKNILRDYMQGISESGDQIIIINECEIALIKRSKNLSEYKSISDFAYMVMSNIEEEIGEKPLIGISELGRNFNELPACFMQSKDAIRIGQLVDPKLLVYRHKDLFLIRLFEELPKERLKRILELFAGEKVLEVFESSELSSTAQQFLHCDLNVSETARTMYMHRNTLIYRLEKIESDLGLNIRRFPDAMTFRMLAICYKLYKKN